MQAIAVEFMVVDWRRVVNCFVDACFYGKKIEREAIDFCSFRCLVFYC